MKYILLILAIPLLIGIFESCSKDSMTKEYLIKIDNLIAPTTINAGIPFQMEFYGIISYGGCAGFSHFSVELSGSVIIFDIF
ncbi:MAG: hypothetical protein ACQERS_11965 [Bacteroidota bacterium]